jgi:AraC-like DNA-binding protein
MGLSKDIKEGGRLLFTSGFHYGRAGYTMAEHLHASWQADWILSGRLTYVIERVKMVIGPQEILFISPQVAHRMMSREGFSCRAIKFELHTFSFSDSTIQVKLAADNPLLGLLAEEIFTQRSTLPWRMSNGYLGALLRLMDPIPVGQEPLSAPITREPILEAHLYAVRHLHEPPTVARMAEVAHLSVPHFTRLFQAATGVSPGRWIAQQRLLGATELLKYADLSISEIASKFGYTDLPTFSKAFKRLKGVSPEQYRALHNLPGNELALDAQPGTNVLEG